MTMKEKPTCKKIKKTESFRPDKKGGYFALLRE